MQRPKRSFLFDFQFTALFESPEILTGRDLACVAEASYRKRNIVVINYFLIESCTCIIAWLRSALDMEWDADLLTAFVRASFGC